ncbi:hypothetical protein IT575_01485 [bacterium]|nr:hypothetical protein [bacterium]
MDAGTEFIRLFNELDEHLKKLTRAQRLRTFPERVAEVARHNATVRRWREELRDFSELRNAIIHDRFYPERIIATPTEEALAQLRSIVEQIVQPRTLGGHFESAVQTFSAADKLVTVLRWLRDHDYSQAVIYDGELRLLTVKGIARWLTAQTEVECLMLGDATLEDALAYEQSGCFISMSRNNTIDEAREAFEHELANGQRKLYAILITQGGKLSQKPLGIITPWDLIEHDSE